MSTVQGGQGNIVTNGLILNLDAANPRSYAPPFNGTTWQNIALVSSSLTGSLIGGVAYTGSNGGALVFDGVDDYVGLGTPSSLNITGNITINSWVNLTAFPSVIGTIYEKGYDNNNDQTFFRFRNNSGTQVLEIGTYQQSNNTNYLTTYNIGSSITTGTWNNIVGQYNGSNWNLYLNSVLVSTTLQNQGPLPSTAPVSIGAAFISSGYARFINGTISVVQVYNRTLTATEVLQNFNATRARFGV